MSAVESVPAAAAADAGVDEVHELDVDIVTVPGQLYVVLSIVGPTGTNQRADKFGLKIRGCFASTEEAHAHVKRLQKFDPTMDIFVADMYKWLLIPPNLDAIENHEYQEEFLNSLIKGYRENQENAKQLFHQRKEAIKRDGLDKHLLDHERLPPPPGVAVPAAEPAPVEQDLPPVDRTMFESDDPHTASRLADAPAEHAE